MASERKAQGISSPDTELWRSIGPVTELSKKSCRLLYSSLGYDSDLCLFHVQGEFFSMDTRCAHAGGPLCEGDIEEADSVLKVFCPWHDYDFDIRTGESQTGLQQQVYEVKVEDGLVYVKHRSQLSLTPFPAAAKE
ncbi:Rieske domain-containing protein-like isoform X2 [Acipenser ruthenus]|uniref:Rieske domain-containing protein-like isoform X2 n=1 Tax=Acipenser ruthenus TaxID=7906 RepID=UPI002741C778|nr:Rieske domain-containing protein-like isoform X2 [Acipenser ruthenus]